MRSSEKLIELRWHVEFRDSAGRFEQIDADGRHEVDDDIPGEDRLDHDARDGAFRIFDRFQFLPGGSI
jgi:hypothetical protein